jgi:hypothetical protein
MKWMDNIKMDLKEIRYRGVDQTLAQDMVEWKALVNTV